MYPNMIENSQTIAFICPKCRKISTAKYVQKGSFTSQMAVSYCLGCNSPSYRTTSPHIKDCFSGSSQEWHPRDQIQPFPCLGYNSGHNLRKEPKMMNRRRNNLFKGPIEICIEESDKLNSHPKFSTFNPTNQTPSPEGSTTLRIHGPPSEQFDFKEFLEKNRLKPSSTATADITRDK